MSENLKFKSATEIKSFKFFIKTLSVQHHKNNNNNNVIIPLYTFSFQIKYILKSTSAKMNLNEFVKSNNNNN